MIYILFMIHACLFGVTDAFLYSRKGAEALPGNEHQWLVAVRVNSFLFAVAGLLYFYWFGWWAFLLLAIEGICIVLGFSFLHNGCYNLLRDRVDGTKNGWQYSSPTDTSETNFNYTQRRNMFYASIAILILAYILLLPFF